MFIFNITINIQEDVQEAWLKWMKEQYIPEMLMSDKFEKVLMCRVLVEEELGGITYSVQFRTTPKGNLEEFRQEEQNYFLKKLKLFEGKYVAFPTELQVVHEQ